MGRKKKPAEYLPENKEVEVSVFTSQEFDLAPKQTKKRRIMDDYDYNDPFLEPLEGENDAVDLECNLENFFVFRGDLEDDAKKVARKYNREKKRRETASSQPEKDTKAANMDQEESVLLDFERTDDYVAFKPSWTKLDSRLTNLLLSLISFYDVGSHAAAESARVALSRANMSVDHLPCPSTKPRPEEMVEYYENLKRDINKLHSEISRVISDKESYSNDGRLFKRFKQSDFMKNLIEFHIFYTKYYVGAGETNIGTARKRATWAILNVFPAICTNHVKIKQYLVNEMSKRIEQLGFDVEQAAQGTLSLANKEEKTDTSVDRSSPCQSSTPETAKESKKRKKKTTGVVEGATDKQEKNAGRLNMSVTNNDAAGNKKEKTVPDDSKRDESSFADNSPQESENDKQSIVNDNIKGHEEDSKADVDVKTPISSSNHSDVSAAIGKESSEEKIEQDNDNNSKYTSGLKRISKAIVHNLERFQSFASGMIEGRVSGEAATGKNEKSDSNGDEYPSIGISTAADFSLEANKTEVESSNQYSSGLEFSREDGDKSA